MAVKVAELVATLELDRSTYANDIDQAQSAFVQLGQRAQQASSDAAKSYQALATEAKKSGDAAKAAATSANSAHASALDTAERVRRKEVDLQKARASGDTEKIIRAEKDLESARRKNEIAAGREATAADKATAAIQRAVTAAERADRAYQQMGQSAARGIQQASAEITQSNPFARLAESARTAGSQAGENLAGGLPGPIKGAVGKAGPVGAAIMAVAAVGILAGKALADNIVAGMKEQSRRGLAQAKFGWTDDQLAAAGDAAGKAYVNGFGDSIDANRTALGEAIQSGLLDGNATADQMQPVVEKLALVSKIMGVDMKDAAIGAGQMIRTGLAKDSAGAFDLITVAQQHGMNLTGEFMDTMQEYGTTYRQLGLDGATALGTIDQLVKGGARNVDQAADALKEFGVNVLSVSKETTGAFERIGLNANDTYAAFAKGGDSARQMSQTVIEKLQGIQDPVVKNEVGLALFKTKWEDVGKAVNGLDLSTAATQLGKVAGAADDAAGKLDGPANSLENAKRSIEKSLGDVQVKLAETFGPKIAEAAEWVSAHTDEITRGFEIVGGVVTTVGGAIGMVGGTVIGVVGEIIEGVGKLMRGVLSPIFTGMEKLGSLMAKMPGQAGELGRSLQAGAAIGREYTNTWVEVGEATSDFGWGMARVSTSITQAGIDLAAGTDKAKSATQAFGDLGVKVREVPEQKRIVIEDNTPETKKKLEELGIKVQTLPDGTVFIDADDEDAKNKIREITKPETKQVTVQVTEARTGSFSAQDRNGNTVVQAPAQDTKVGTPGKSTGGVGSRANPDGSTTHTRGGKVVDASGKPTGASANPVKPTQIQQTTEEKEKAAKQSDKEAKKAEAEKKKADAAEKKAQKEKEKVEKAAEKARTDLSKAQADIPAKQRALAAAEQRAREVAANPKASGSSRISAQNSVASAREALDKAVAKTAELQGKVTTTADAAAKVKSSDAAPTGTDGKPLTVTGVGTGGTLNVGTGSKPMQVEPANSAQGDGMRVFVTNMPAGGVGGGIKLSLFSSGGPVSGPGSGTSDSIPAMLSNGEFVVNAAQTARFGGLLQAINSGRIRAFRDGGAVTPNAGVTGGTVQFGNVSGAGITTQEQQDAWDAIRQAFPGASLNSATRTQDVGSGFDFHMAGEAIDIGGSPQLMMQIAEWIAANYPNSRELIHGPGFAKQIKNGKIVGDGGGEYGFYAGAGRHDDHVHWTPPSGFTFGGGLQVVGADGKTVPLGAVGLTAESSREDVAKAIIGEGRKRGYDDDEIKAILATALGESDLKMQNNPAGWNGFFQQDESYEGRNDPNRNITGFFDELDKGGKDSKIWQRIVGVQQHHDAGYTGETSGDMDYLGKMTVQSTAAAELFDKLKDSIPTGTTGAGATASPTGTTTPTSAGGTQNVFVTNWPSNLSGGGSQFKFSLFADGGRVRGPGTGTSDSIPAMLSNGEYVVRAQAARANYGLLETINRADTPLRLAGGGPVIAPKIEAPKITPTLGPGMAIPIPGAGSTAPAVGASAPSVGTTGFNPLAALQGARQEGVSGTQSPQEYAVQRLIQYGGDMAKIGIQAAKEIFLPSGLDSQQAQNVLSLVKGVGTGIQSSYEKSQSQSSTSTDSTGTKSVTNNTTNNFYTQNVDEAFRKQTRNDSIKALSYDGSLV